MNKALKGLAVAGSALLTIPVVIGLPIAILGIVAAVYVVSIAACSKLLYSAVVGPSATSYPSA